MFLVFSVGTVTDEGQLWKWQGVDIRMFQGTKVYMKHFVVEHVELQPTGK